MNAMEFRVTAHDTEEQGTPKASDNMCVVCNLPKVLLISGATLKCSCGPHELVAADDSIPDTADIKYRSMEACQTCDWCGGGVGKPCLRPDHVVSFLVESKWFPQ